VVDLGGGSLQITEVEDRSAVRVASLPLGALRLTDQFVRTDPADGPTVNVLRRHIQRALETLPWLKNAGGQLVGVGGTIRTLAKMSRRAAEWPIPHAHGYRLSADDVESSWELVSRTDAARRRDIPGLPAHRVDLVVAGSLVVRQLLRFGDFEALEVSSSGVREGAALLHRLGPDARVADIREAGLRARFGGTADELAWAGSARASAEALFDALAAPLGLDPTLRDTFAVAARLRALWERRSPVPGPLSALLERPIQGFFQREVLAVADLVSPVPRLRIDLGIRARLAVLLDLVAAARGRPLRCAVDADTVRRIARLARIAVAEDEVEHLKGELNAMLAFVEQLQEVDVAGVEPMTSVTPMAMKMRKDEVTDGGNAEAVLANAPQSEDGFYLVPKVIE
jgi:aspartyl-tRNA(Asn)/glutamyl-tRNA(Gln) amidotransferase subunit C